MHSAIPFPRFGAEGLDDAARGQLEQRIRQLKNLCEVRGLRYYVHRGVLPCGAAYTFIWNHGIHKVIVEPVQQAAEERPGTAHVDVPMFFSGEALSTAVRYGQDGEVIEGAQLSLTQQCRRRLEGYTGAMAPQRVRLRRFVIGYANRFDEFIRPSGMKILQYAQLRPTWWSGRMAAVVQLAQGYGIHDFENLPDAPYEKATLPVPEEVGAQIAQQLGLDAEGNGGAILPACKGWPVKSGETQFDYKASRTEGVAFGSDRAPWLVRISSQGVFAMPLPIVPATRTTAFREWIEQVGDEEIKWLLDTFGGTPSGEGFPESPEEFAAWRRAGVIIRMGSAGGFYALTPYSSATGWSFNNAGTQAVNTGWRFGDDGLKRGEFWSLHMSIGAVADKGLAREVVIPSGTGAVFIERAQRYISMVEQAAAPALQQGNALVRAALYAFRRAPFDDIMARAANSLAKAEGELEYWRNYEALPIALASCAAAKIGEGILWAPGEPKYQPQIKFPEPAAEPQGCYSFDFGRLEGSAPPHPEPLCDTIMHAYFIGDDLKVVKYFRDTREVAARVDRNYDEGDVLTVGTWLETITYTPSGLMGNFYTSDFDERELAAEHSKTTKTTGSDKGYDNPPFFQQDYTFSTGGMIWRNRYVQYDQQAWEVKSYGARVAICIPYFAPHAALYAWKWDKTGNVKTTARGVGGIRDPNSYRYTTYHFVWAWSGSGAPANKENYNGELDPSPMIKKVGDPVWVIGYNYDPGTPGSDFADQGNWMGGLPQDYTWLVNPNAGGWKSSGGGSPPTVKQFTRTEYMPDETGGSLQVSYAQHPMKIMDETPDIRYFASSPDDFGAVFYRDAARNEAGSNEYGNVSEIPEGQICAFPLGLERGGRQPLGAPLYRSTDMTVKGERIHITPILGMNNAEPPEAMRRAEPPGTMVREALNVNINAEGTVTMRRGLRRVTNEPYEWLWQNPLTGEVFGSLRGQWVRVNRHNWTHEVLAEVGTGRTTHMLLGGQVVCAAPRGIFTWDGERALPLGLPKPPAPMLATASGEGSLTEGTYGAAIAWKRGEMLSPLSVLAGVPVKAGDALTVTFPLALGADAAGITGVRLFLTKPNGGELLRAGDFALDAGQVRLPLLPALGEAARWRQCEVMPTGEHLGLWHGRLVTASGRTLRFSEPLAYHICDERHGFVQMPQTITFIAPVEGGIWLGQRTHVDFLAGGSPGELTLASRAGKAPVPYSAVMLDAETAGEISGGGRAVCAWLAANGFVLGTADGQMMETQARRLQGITGTYGSSAVWGDRIAAAVA